MSNVIVLIHGFPFDHTMWYATIAALGAGTRAIVPDLPGFGRTPVSEREPSMEVFAHYLNEHLEELNVRSAIIAGMSMGGYVALSFAELFPEKVRGLALISTQTAADTGEAKANRFKLIEKIRAEGPGAALKAMAPKMFSTKHENNPDFHELLAKGAEQAGVAGLCWALEAMAKRKDKTAVIAKLNVPILVLHGSADKIIPIERMAGITQGKAEGYFLPISEAGHATPLETPDPIAQALLKFQNRVNEEQLRASALTST